MWGKRKGRKRQDGGESHSEHFFLFVNNRLQRWAGFLQGKMHAWSPKKQKTVLALFCFLFISAGAFTIWHTLHHNDYLLEIDPIRPFPLKESIIRRPLLNKAEHDRLHRLRHTLDSLAQTKKGRRTLDSILTAYPDLPAMVLELDSRYHQQTKNRVYEK